MDAAAIADEFHRCFRSAERVTLQGGATEPLYEPASASTPAVIYFRENYAASALHEIAHWCIAGPARRQQPDYGYWYIGNRNDDAQSRFEQAEVRPQALEWIFCESAGLTFRVSSDNFDMDVMTQERRDAFRTMVRDAACEWLRQGLPHRARIFTQALLTVTHRREALEPSTYRKLPT